MNPQTKRRQPDLPEMPETATNPELEAECDCFLDIIEALKSKKDEKALVTSRVIHEMNKVGLSILYFKGFRFEIDAPALKVKVKPITKNKKKRREPATAYS